MARTHRTSTTWTGITLAALLLAGCTGQTPDPPVQPSPTQTATPSPTATSVAIAPPRPAAMDDDGPKGAEAAAVYFMALDEYMQATGDTRDWDAMSHSLCDFCANRSDQAHQIADADYTFSGGTVQTTIIRTYAQDEATGIWPIDIDVTVTPTTVTDTSGTVVFSADTETSHRRIEMLWNDHGWSVIGVGHLDEDAK